VIEQAPIVGREREQQRLLRLLDEACDGVPRFAFVSGEPGIGKTCLLADLLRRADEQECVALGGSAAEFERELPFAPFVDALDDYLDALDPQAFGRLASEDLGELAGVFRAFRSHTSTPLELGTAANRFRAYRAVRELLGGLAARQPVVLVLDDLHWADGASLELVAHLLRRPVRGPVLLAAAFRPGQADPALVAELARAQDAGVAERLELGPLASADANALIGDAVREHERARLYAASGGNPFYMLQLARSDADGRSQRAGPRGEDHLDVPASVAAAIVRELEGVSPPAREFVRAAAVAGDPFELDLAVAAGGTDEADALRALDELVACDLVRQDRAPRRFRFRHPLVRSAVYDASPLGARLAAHARSSDALAARGAPATARAHHVEQSAHHGDAAAIEVLRAAGEATEQRAPLSAARWFEAAHALLPSDAGAAERIDLLMRLAAAQAATGRFEDSRSALLASLDLAAEDPELRASITVACAVVEQLLGRYGAAQARLTGALDDFVAPSSPAAVEVMLTIASGAFFQGHYGHMRDWGDRALTAARGVGDDLLEVAATAALAVAAAFGAAIPQARAHRERAAALIDALPDRRLGLRLDAMTNLTAAELYLDRYDDAVRHARRGLDLARTTGRTEFSFVLVQTMGVSLWISGRLAEAAEVFEGATEAARLSGNAQALGWNLLNASMVARVQGDLDRAVAAARESADVTRGSDQRLVACYGGVALGCALLDDGQPEGAIAELVTAAGGEDLPAIPGGWRGYYLELLTRAWLALDRPEDAARSAAAAAALADHVGLPLARSMADRAAAAVALHAGDLHSARDRALAAAAVAEEIGARVDAAMARTVAGRALLRAGDRDPAIAELERAAVELDACGARRQRDEAERVLAGAGRRLRRRPGRRDGDRLSSLSDRELEVARLVVDRHTNAEIAARLYLSVKTVESHLRAVFQKLGVTSRVEVARLVERLEREALG
jgi:DNA-binding CsgD family transcriptional regulator/tetratricopeptide (TPR) repeat protein